MDNTNNLINNTRDLGEHLHSLIHDLDSVMDKLLTDFDDLYMAEDADYKQLIDMSNAICHVATKITEAAKEATFVLKMR